MSSKKKREEQAKHNARYANRRQERLGANPHPFQPAPAGYALADLLEANNQALYEEVNAATPVVLKPSQDDSWRSELTKDNRALIYYVHPSDAPRACFTHELLHMKFEREGIRCPGVVDNDGIMGNQASAWVRQFYNDFMHHKMYPIYKKMGYPPNKFLADSDHEESQKALEQQLAQLEKQHNEKKGPLRNYQVGAAYMMTNNPHDADAGIDFGPFKQRIVNLSHPELVPSIDALLEEWKNTPNPDCRLFLAKFFRICGHPNVGFGYKQDELIWAKDV